MAVDRYRINTALDNMARAEHVILPDDILNEMTHYVADIIEGYLDIPATDEED